MTHVTAAQLAALYASGGASPVDALQAVLARIAACEPQLQALYALDADAALAAARESEARWQAGRPLSALDGVPCTVKENIATRGVPVPLGTAAAVLVPAEADAPPAARLREAGCVIVAKTTMPDYGMLSSSLSSFHPLTRNPWDLRKTPGGSSSGAGAAAAAGYGPLHIGTDIGGSIRLPAGWCGVVGFKPSAGRVPIHPPYTGRVAGPLARTVDDVAHAMAVLSRPDARDATSLRYEALDWVGRVQAPRALRGVRIGLLLDAGWGSAVEPEVADAVTAAARAFEQAGAIVEPIVPFSTRTMVEGLNTFWRLRTWLEIASLPPQRQVLVLPYIRAWAESGAHASGADVFHGHAQIAALRDAAVAACDPFDAVLSPTSAMPAFDAERASPLDDPARPFEHIAFTLPYNMSEQPAITVPCGMTRAGLPIGLQLAGRRHDDVGVLQLARAYEAMRPPLPPWPQ